MKKKSLMRGKNLLAAISIFFLSACSHAGGTFCKIYIPVYSSKSDSEETRRQIDMNNVAYLELCR